LFVLVLLFLVTACRDSAENSVLLTPTSNSAQFNGQAFAGIGGGQSADATSAPFLKPPAADKPVSPSASGVPTALPCNEPGQIVSGIFDSAIAGPQRNYRIYLPPCYGQQARLYPTLYLLHGNVRADWEWEEVGMLDSADKLIQSGAIPPLIIVMPDGRTISDNTSGGPYSYEAVIMNELIPHIEATYCAANHARLRAIGGISRGGYWALETAFLHPEAFASVGGHSAALYDLYAGSDINPQYTGIDNDLGTLRIYFDIGEDDYLRENIERLHEEMLVEGVPHVWQLNDGQHADPYWSEHVDEYLRWYTEPWQGLNLAVAACDATFTAGEPVEPAN
jgi:enterochelin esterase-like enzyme